MPGTKRFGPRTIEFTITDNNGVLCHLSLKPSSLYVTDRGKHYSYKVPIQKLINWAKKEGTKVPNKEV